jgi:sigma-B regulation protein RsbU (phosphoserine phosphatase)
MRISFSLRRLALRLLAIVFAACATTYSVLWIMHQEYVHPQPGFTNYEYSASSGAMQVGEVFPGSPAEKAGLRPGDRIIAIDGQPLADLRPFYQAIIIGHKNMVELTVEQPGSAAGQRQIRLVVGGGKRVPPRTVRPEDLLGSPIDFYPLGFLVVGVTVLLLRPDDRNAWLLALLFGGFLADAPFFEGNFPPTLRGFAVFYKIVMSWASLALFYYFFAVFPASSPINRKIPWLKYLLLAAAIITTVPIGVRCLLAGGTLPLYLGMHWPGTPIVPWVLTFQAGLPSSASHDWLSPKLVLFGSFIGAVTLGLVSLLSNNSPSVDAQVRRKAHVMLWGTVIGVGPVCLVAAIVFVSGVPTFPLVLWQIAVLLLLSVWPLSFAYAVVKYRVLEIPVLLKRSARYVLVQRGYIVLLFVAAAIAIAFFTHTISRFFPEGTNIGMAVSAVFGIVLVWASAPIVKRGTEQIDRAFFRSSYDARIILQDLVENARTVTGRHELASLLENKIAGALHPKSLACYIARNGSLAAESAPHGETGTASLPRPNFPVRFGAVFIPQSLDSIPADLPLLQELTNHGKAWDVPPSAGSADESQLAPECLVPILGRNSRLIGLLVLGQRRSEEPYSREDKQLLESVASQAGVTLENIQLAETMVQRMEAERRVTMEMDFARRVQARLFPQKLPSLETLDYVGGCIQAQQVGGDYYDFLDMGPGVLGIVLADISGKGMPGALLMANLQANLRSQYAVALDDLPRLLKSVNRLFYENTTDEAYATMFFGVYEDCGRTLRFANCGHVPPMILHADATIERLASTTTVLGLFLNWDSPIVEAKLRPGDLLIICTDGVTESPNAYREEYGEARLLRVVQENRSRPVHELLTLIQKNVQEFSGPTQADDITVIIARCY